jgi:exodeoxyribonuclease I
MAASFLFYDLETSGVNPKEARVMQFAGQRTDMDLQPVGEPYNYLIRLSPDVLPDPQAIMITGITPQQTIAEGLSEAEFLDIFHRDIAQPGTIFTGFNSVRFDDEFMRYLNYRNFYDPYEWAWRDDRSRWDMLDVVRMTRALRPDGITWPFASNGTASNRLELLTSVNSIAHEDAHDALSDVQATIAVARLVKEQQPKLFSFLLEMRQKQKVANLVEADNPFVYSSGRFDSAHEKTTVAAFVGSVADQSGAVYVADLRYDPSDLLSRSVDDVVKALQVRHDERPFPVPLKQLKYNRCPAVAPLGVIDAAAQQRLSIDMPKIKRHYGVLKQRRAELSQLADEVFARLREAHQQPLLPDEQAVDSQLYDGFVPDADKPLMAKVRDMKPAELSIDAVRFRDDRLRALLPLYKARNYPEFLSAAEQASWDEFCHNRIMGGSVSWLQRYAAQLQKIAAQDDLSPDKRYLLEELQLYAESLHFID